MFKILLQDGKTLVNYLVCNTNKSGIHSLKPFKEINGPKRYPLIGTLYKYWPLVGDYDTEALDKIAWENWRKYGGMVRENPGVNVLHLFEPDLIELAFRQKDRYPERRSHTAMLQYRLSKPHVYNTGGLLSTNGEPWWRLRSAFQKYFSSPQSAKQYIEATDGVANEFVQWVKCRIVSPNEDFLLYLNRLYLEVIGLIAFNERFQSFTPEEQNSNSRTSRIIRAAFESNSGVYKLDIGVMWRFFNTPLYKRLVKSQEYLEKISTDILMKKVHYFEHSENKDDNSLLCSFLKLQHIDLKDITGMIVDILMAAIDTTSYATSFALYHLARNQDCQNKCFEEISTLLPQKDSKINADIISRAVYVKGCIKESLRLNPVSIGVGRVLQNDIVLKGYSIPRGTVIVSQNMVASQLPQYVSDPSRFKPERWIRDSCHYENIHPFLSLPFGYGPRSCIARRLAEQNMCIALIRLMREFRITWTGEDLGIKTHLINKPNKPISLSFTARK